MMFRPPKKRTRNIQATSVLPKALLFILTALTLSCFELILPGPASTHASPLNPLADNPDEHSVRQPIGGSFLGGDPRASTHRASFDSQPIPNADDDGDQDDESLESTASGERVDVVPHQFIVRLRTRMVRAVPPVSYGGSRSGAAEGPGESVEGGGGTVWRDAVATETASESGTSATTTPGPAAGAIGTNANHRYYAGRLYPYRRSTNDTSLDPAPLRPRAPVAPGGWDFIQRAHTPEPLSQPSPSTSAPRNTVLPQHGHFIAVPNWRELVRDHRTWITGRIASYNAGRRRRRLRQRLSKRVDAALGPRAAMRWWYDGGASGIFQGYAVRGPPEMIAEIRRRDDVEWVGVDTVAGFEDAQVGAQPSLRRLSSPTPQLQPNYLFPTSSGRGVVVFVIDSGVQANTTTAQFGRAGFGPNVSRLLKSLGKSFVSTERSLDPYQDARGHGTHCAGIIASASFGVAKEAGIVSYRVFGTGPDAVLSDIIAAIIDSSAVCKSFGDDRACVLNLSLSSAKVPPPGVDALFQAVEWAASPDGNTVPVIAAGNQNVAACLRSPAGAGGGAITVGAVGANDIARAGFSNFGGCVDVWAPGLDVNSLSATQVNGSRLASGTSMAAPQVAGLAATFLSLHPDSTPLDVRDGILQNAHRDFVKGDLKGAPNLLAFNGGEAGL